MSDYYYLKPIYISKEIIVNMSENHYHTDKFSKLLKAYLFIHHESPSNYTVLKVTLNWGLSKWGFFLSFFEISIKTR